MMTYLEAAVLLRTVLTEQQMCDLSELMDGDANNVLLVEINEQIDRHYPAAADRMWGCHTEYGPGGQMIGLRYPDGRLDHIHPLSDDETNQMEAEAEFVAGMDDA